MPDEARAQEDAESTGDAAPAPGRLSVLLRSAGGWASAALCLLVMVALGAGYGPMRARAAGMAAGPPRVQFDWPPLAGLTSSTPPSGVGEPMTWVNAEIREELMGLVLGKLGNDAFDRAALNNGREALAATGWFRDDLRLSRDLTGLVRVSGTWRIPAAAVRSGGQDMLIASGAELLPVKYQPGASGYKVILGASQEPPALGKAWVGGDVQAGLALLDLLRSLPGAEQIAGVDVGDYAHGRMLTLVTQAGNRILWGGPVDEFNPGQATPAVKLARLAEVYREFGRIDAGRAVLDVRLVDGVYIHDTAGVMARAQQAAAEATRSSKKPKSQGRQ